MRRLTFFLMALYAISSFSYNFETEFNGRKIYFDVVSLQEGILSVAAPNDDHPYSGNLEIPSLVLYNGISCAVRQINKDAFIDNELIESIKFPGTLDTLDLSCFENCTNLKTLSLTQIGVNDRCRDLVFVPAEYELNTKLDSLFLDRNVYVLPENIDGDEYKSPFFYANSLRKVTFGSNIKNLPPQFFANTRISEIEMPANVKEIEDGSFSGMRTLVSFSAAGLNNVPQKAFYGCSSLEKVVLGSSINIYSNAFQNCSKLKNITLPNNLQTIHNQAFYGCSSLDTIVVPDKVSYIGDNCFVSCLSLKLVSLPNSLKEMGASVFWNCQSLDSINIPSQMTSLPAMAFSNCYSLSHITLPKSVKQIGARAFRYCRSFTSFTLPSSVEVVGIQCFLGMDNLKTLVIEDGDGIMEFSTSTESENQIFYNSPVDSVYLGKLVTGHDNQDQALCSPFRELTSLRAVCFGPAYKIIPSSLLYSCSNLKIVDIHSNLTSIEEKAFYGCRSLKEFTMPSSVKELGAGAFRGMAFEKITLSDSISCIRENTFAGCSSLKEINLPANLKTIENGAFSGCTSLKTISIPECIDTIANRAYNGCSSLHKVVFEEADRPLGIFVSLDYRNQVFAGCALDTVIINRNLSYAAQSGLSFFFSEDSKLNYVEFGDKVTTLNPYFFTRCSNLKSVVFGKGLKKIPYNAMSGCGALKTVSANYIDEIDEYAFQNCTALDSVDLSSLEVIGNNTFIGCTSLKKIVTSSKLKKIGNSAFQNTGVDKFDFSNSLEEVGASAFSKTRVNKVIIPDNIKKVGDMAFGNCELLDTIEFPETMTYIPSMVCYNSSNLSSVLMPSVVDSIGSAAFSGCARISEVVLPSNLKVIGESAFSGCSSLNEISFPSKVVEIGSSAFSKCINIKELYIPDNIKSINSSAFAGCSSLNKIEIFKSADTLSIYSIPDNSAQALYGGATAKEYENSNQPFYGTHIDSLILHRDVSFTSDTVSAFEFLKHLVYLEIDTTVSHIPPYTFRHCDKLDYIRVLSGTPPVLGFKNFKNRHVYVPDTAVLRYCLTDYWKDNIIVGAVHGEDTIHVDVVDGISLRGGINRLGRSIPTVCAMSVAGTLESDDWRLVRNDLTNLYYFDGGELTNKEIPDSVFANNTKVRAVVLPGSVTTIGSNSFYDSGIKKIIFSNRLVRICRKAYYGTDINAVDFPASLLAMEDSAFANCQELLDVYTHTLTPLEMPDSVFASCQFDTCVLHVPFGTKEKYASAPGWKVFKNIVEEYEGVEAQKGPGGATEIESQYIDDQNIIDIYTIDGKFVASVKSDVQSITASLPVGRYLLKTKDKVLKVYKNK